MPITLNENLPAYRILSDEGVMVMSPGRAATQDIRPLRIALLNLMPKKIQTENQFARLIGATPLQIDFQLIRMSDHESRNTAADHMESFYRPFRDVAATGEKFDGLLITGAPVEKLPFEDVTYWDELTQVFAWTQSHVHSTFGVCWGGMAMAWHFHRLEKHALDRKAFGCFRHHNQAPASPYLRGFSDDVLVPVSRWTEVRQTDVDAPRAVCLQPFRIRQHHAQGRIRPRRGSGQADQRAVELLSRRRSGPRAVEPLAQPCASALR